MLWSTDPEAGRPNRNEANSLPDCASARSGLAWVDGGAELAAGKTIVTRQAGVEIDEHGRAHCIGPIRSPVPGRASLQSGRLGHIIAPHQRGGRDPRSLTIAKRNVAFVRSSEIHLAQYGGIAHRLRLEHGVIVEIRRAGSSPIRMWVITGELGGDWIDLI